MAEVQPLGAKSLELQPLSASILTTNCEVLNAANPEVLSLVLSTGAEAALRSDCDEQLLLTVPFATPVKLHTLQFAAQEGASRGAPWRPARPSSHLAATRARARPRLPSVRRAPPRQAFQRRSSSTSTACR